MKLRLIQTAGFAGRYKIAETELAEHSDEVKQCVSDVFNDTTDDHAPSNARDKENLLLEFDGKSIPLYEVKVKPAFKPSLASLIQQMTDDLKYR